MTIDLNHSYASGDVSDIINKKIDHALTKKNRETPPRNYLGASILGNPCSRQIQWNYEQVEKDEGKGFSGQTLRIFEAGHSFEDMAIGWIREAGIDLKTEKEDGSQFGFSVAQGKIAGHIDGVILDGPSKWQYPMLWECKSANQKKFNEFRNNGLESTNQTYAAQVAIYQAYMKLENPALFTVVNKNTCELYHEVIPFNNELAQRISDKAANILSAVQSSTLMPRVANNSDYYFCRWCDFYERCWNEEG